MILGPVHGHPVQPKLTGQGNAPAQQGQLTAVAVETVGLMDDNDNKSLNRS